MTSRLSIRALTLAALLLKPHEHGEHGHVQQEALPRLGIGIIGGLVAYMFFLAPIGHAFGIEIGGHGAETASHTSAGVLWALRAGVFVGGALAGWFAGIVINRLLGAFFRAFNWMFDVTINIYGSMVAGLLRISAVVLLVYGGLMGLTYMGFQAVPWFPGQDKGPF
jgi:multidrug efflux pump subunit AcrB